MQLIFKREIIEKKEKNKEVENEDQLRTWAGLQKKIVVKDWEQHVQNWYNC